MAQTLARDIVSATCAISSVLRDIPVLNDGDVEVSAVHSLLFYTAGVCQAVRTGPLMGAEQPQELTQVQPTVHNRVGFLAKSLSDSLKRYAMRAPRTKQATAIFVHCGSNKTSLAFIERTRATASASQVAKID